jgi:multidrug efflux pump subunit AcrB
LSRTEYQYTLQDIDMSELQQWAPKVEAKLKKLPGLKDVASDLEQTSPQLTIRINRDLASPRMRGIPRDRSLVPIRHYPPPAHGPAE